jgi:acyl carrier protein
MSRIILKGNSLDCENSHFPDFAVDRKLPVIHRISAVLVDAELRKAIKEMMVKHLMLDMNADEIKNDEPLFGGGLGLDSVDALQLVVALERDFSLKLDDSDHSKSILANVESIAQAIEKVNG